MIKNKAMGIKKKLKHIKNNFRFHICSTKY